MKKKSLRWAIASFGLVILASAPLTVWANNSANKKITLQETETVTSNYYAGGETVTIDGTVEGDAIVAGGMVVVNGIVKGDLIVAAGQLEINGTIGGSVLGGAGVVNINGAIADNARLAAGQINIDSTIGKNLLAASGTLIIDDDAVVEGTTTAASGMLNARGLLKNNLDFVGGQVTLANIVNGNANLTISEDIAFQKNAKITGDLNYKARQKADIDESMVSGTITYKKMVVPQADGQEMFRALKLFALGMTFVWVIGTILIALIMIMKYPNVTKALTTEMWEKPWEHIGKGILWLIVTPIALVVLAFTGIGIPLAFLLGTGYIIGAYVSVIVLAMGLAHWMITWEGKKKKESKWKMLGLTALAVIVLMVVFAIPVLGMIIKIVGIAWGFHVLITVKCRTLKKI